VEASLVAMDRPIQAKTNKVSPVTHVPIAADISQITDETSCPKNGQRRQTVLRVEHLGGRLKPPKRVVPSRCCLLRLHTPLAWLCPAIASDGESGIFQFCSSGGDSQPGPDGYVLSASATAFRHGHDADAGTAFSPQLIG
jgi:hypothetical protein